jgi:hypothetical protein
MTIVVEKYTKKSIKNSENNLRKRLPLLQKKLFAALFNSDYIIEQL